VLKILTQTCPYAIATFEQLKKQLKQTLQTTLSNPAIQGKFMKDMKIFGMD